MNEQMKIYAGLATPPKEALKKITGGRLNGMTDIRPQWRYRVMTEQFGLCGAGWKYSITRQWTEAGADGEIMAFVDVDLYVKVDGEWSQPIPGTGGSMLVSKERNGMHNSDEAYKMATTDALSVAMKMIGVAASVYEGQDVSKYTNPAPEEKPPAINAVAAEMKAALAELEASGEDGAVIDSYRIEGTRAYKNRDIAALRDVVRRVKSHGQEAYKDKLPKGDAGVEPELPDSEPDQGLF